MQPKAGHAGCLIVQRLAVMWAHAGQAWKGLFAQKGWCSTLAVLHDGSPAARASCVFWCLLQGWQRAWGPNWSPWLRSRSCRRSCSSAVRCAAHLGCLKCVIQAKPVSAPASGLVGLWSWLFVSCPLQLGVGACPSPDRGPVLNTHHRSCVFALWALTAGHVITS